MTQPRHEKNPHAVALGRLGGLKKCPKGFAVSRDNLDKALAARKIRKQSDSRCISAKSRKIPSDCQEAAG